MGMYLINKRRKWINWEYIYIGGRILFFLFVVLVWGMVLKI